MRTSGSIGALGRRLKAFPLHSKFHTERRAAYPFGKCLTFKAESETAMIFETRVCRAHFSIFLLLLDLRQSPPRHRIRSLGPLRGWL